MTPTTRDHLADVDRKLRGRLEIRAAAPLDEKDINYVHDIIMMRTALLYDLLDGSTQEAFTSTWERTILGLRTLDVELYSRDWKTLREVLTSRDFLYTCTEEAADTDTFKRCLAGRVHYKWTLNATIALMEGCDDWFKVANQWVVFDSRANLPSLDLSVSCCEEYLAFEGRAPLSPEYYLDLAETNPDVKRDLMVLRRSASDLFGDFKITDYPYRPRHGNGATVEVERGSADPWHKNRHFAVDGEIITYLRHRCQEVEWRDNLYYPYRGLDRTSTLVCVPKSMTSNRTISKEPTTLQFLQQDIFAALDDYFDSHECHIDLHDQATSRRLALAGSRDASYATIDLSCASDSVSLATIETFFGGLPVEYPLLATRSEAVHVRSKDGDIDTTIRTRKFAPMGSATCFPTECMVFATICEAAIRLTAGRKSRRNDYVVYGDDIVIRTEFARECVRLLTRFGFVVNTSKSFGVPDHDKDSLVYEHMQFREACGIEALNGRDVTPLRLSRRLVSITHNDSDRLAGLGVGMVDLMNRAYLHGYWILRQYVNSKLATHKWYRTILRLSYSDYTEFTKAILLREPSWITVSAPFVIVDDATDTQWRAFRARFNRDWYRVSVLVSVVKPRSRNLPIEAERYDSQGRRLFSALCSDGQPHDENDFFTWCYRSTRSAVAENIFDLDDTGVITIRPRDLKWSKAWVCVQRTPHLISIVQSS